MVQRRGAASYYMRDRIHVQNAKQNAVMMCAIFFSFPNFGTILFWPISLLIIPVVVQVCLRLAVLIMSF